MISIPLMSLPLVSDLFRNLIFGKSFIGKTGERINEPYRSLFLLFQVVNSVVKNGEPNLIKPLSLAAAHCMGEVKLSSQTRETEHSYKNNVMDEVGRRCLP